MSDGKESDTRVLVIGICGGTGSGKTTLVKRVLHGFETESASGVVVLSHDDYYRHRDDLALEEREALNYDHPDALETDLMVKHIRDIKAGKSPFIPKYDFTKHLRSPETREIVGADVKVLIVEGILIFASKGLVSELDISLFIDVPADIRFIRRLKRDTSERGRTPQSVIDQYLTTVRPMHDQYVQPFASAADLVIPYQGSESDGEGAVSMLYGKIAHQLSN